MPKATLKHPKEHFESLLRRFKKAVDKADTLKEVRKREHFEKNCEIKKRKKAAAKKRWKKKFEESCMPIKESYNG